MTVAYIQLNLQKRAVVRVSSVGTPKLRLRSVADGEDPYMSTANDYFFFCKGPRLLQ
jgi:hypothetical protein